MIGESNPSILLHFSSVTLRGKDQQRREHRWGQHDIFLNNDAEIDEEIPTFSPTLVPTWVSDNGNKENEGANGPYTSSSLVYVPLRPRVPLPSKEKNRK